MARTLIELACFLALDTHVRRPASLRLAAREVQARAQAAASGAQHSDSFMRLDQSQKGASAGTAEVMPAHCAPLASIYVSPAFPYADASIECNSGARPPLQTLSSAVWLNSFQIGLTSRQYFSLDPGLDDEKGCATIQPVVACHLAAVLLEFPVSLRKSSHIV